MIDQEEYLISFSNLKSGLFKNQDNFLNDKKLIKYYNNTHFGIPICLPNNIKYFDYSKANFFEIDKKYFSKKIFGTSNLNYIGNKKYFRYGSTFAYNVKIKKKYKPKVRFYMDNVKSIKSKILQLNKKKQKICAMQIRNVPHFGHEAVFKFILKEFDLLILNPIYGIKKKNDFSDRLISIALKYMEKKYKNIKFLPFFSNFHYAGPREAFHHMHIRENLGFENFYIGRDHAGAENNFKPLDAIKAVKKEKSKFKLNIFSSSGGYYCQKCSNYIIKGTCKHQKLKNISGTSFREYLFKKRLYPHADKQLQNLINKKI